MKVRNMQSVNGNNIPNQFIISGLYYANKLISETGFVFGTMFQSYDSNIVFEEQNGQIYLDEKYWNYSKTTGKYRNIFLGETKAETQKKIDSGEYILTNLN